jgi:ribosome-binding factor A
MSGDVKRSVRVAERIREEVASTLNLRISDPRVKGTVVTRVDLSPDLQSARVFVRLSENDSEESRKQALRGLKSACPVIRRGLGKALDLRRIPELNFFIDEGMDAQVRIVELLDEIARERKGSA